MFATTHTPVAWWVVVNANDKRSARIKAILHKDPEVAAAPLPAERSRPRVPAADLR